MSLIAGRTNIDWVLLGVLMTVVFPFGYSSRILIAISPASTLSHYLNFRKVMGALTDRQHEVTFLMSATNAALSHKKTAIDDSFRFVTYRGPRDASQIDESHRRFQEEITRKTTTDGRVLQSLMKAVQIYNASTENPWHQSAVECDSILGNVTLISILKSDNYDLLIGDPAANLCTPLLAEVLSVPFLQYAVEGFNVLRHDRWSGQSIYPSFMPMPLLRFCDDMSFQERVINFLRYIIAIPLIDRRNLALFEEVKIKYAIRPEVSLSNLLLESQLVLVNSYVNVLEFARPLLPNVIPVGGVTAEPAQPLDENLEEFFEGSGQNGVVVIAMGSSLRFDDASTRDIAGALSRLQQNVIWMHRGTRPTNIGNNTKVVDWLPINDALGHPKTKVLVSHGGASTILEAIYHGVPMVLVPLAGDMFDNTARAVCRGVAVRLDMPTLTGNVLQDAIQRVTADRRFKATSVHLSGIVKETTPSPVDNGAFWIEHVLKHGGDHLRPASANSLMLHQYLLLDVLVIVSVCCAVLLKFVSVFLKRQVYVRAAYEE